MPSVQINGRDLSPHKATTRPDLGARTVLTNSHWEYVALWLRRERKTSALFYWQQAQIFSQAAQGMPVNSAPLLLYYSFLNGVKALLSAKGVPFEEGHGVRGHNMRGPSSKITLSNEGVRLLDWGIARALSKYLSEAEGDSIHSLEELLFNIPCIHRTYCLTYKSQKDLFIPLTNNRIEFDATSGTAYFAAMLSKDFAGPSFIRRLPASLIADPVIQDGRTIRSAAVVALPGAEVRSAADKATVAALLTSLRPDLNYIAGAQTLWYAKAVVPGPTRLQRYSLTCIFLAMHRLSEICRYRPMELAAFLAGQKNWLLTEFIRMSPLQFLDEISSELTGQQFMVPNVRPAS